MISQIWIMLFFLLLRVVPKKKTLARIKSL